MTAPAGGIVLRPARIDDAEGILAIYAPYVEASPVTFETQTPSKAEFEQRMRDTMECYPYIVAEAGGELAGYAYAHRIGERAAYAWNAELSVYLDPKKQGAGIGRRLCESVIDLLAAQGVRNVFSLITIPNEASVGLHCSLGFSLMGTQRQAGFKCGAWHDVAWYQKQIGDFAGEPSPLVAASQLDGHLVEAVLRTPPQTGAPEANPQTRRPADDLDASLRRIDPTHRTETNR